MGVNWGTGLSDLKADLRTLGAHVDRKAAGLVEHYANLAAWEARGLYRSANLAGGVAVRRRGAHAYSVMNRAPHAHWFELGTATRFTRRGWHRGAMPAARPKPMATAAVRARRQMNQALETLITREGGPPLKVLELP